MNDQYFSKYTCGVCSCHHNVYTINLHESATMLIFTICTKIVNILQLAYTYLCICTFVWL